MRPKGSLSLEASRHFSQPSSTSKRSPSKGYIHSCAADGKEHQRSKMPTMHCSILVCSHGCEQSLEKYYPSSPRGKGW